MLRFPPKRIVFSRGGASVVACAPAWHVAVQDAELEILVVPFWHSRVTQYENELASGLCNVNRCRLLRLELAFVLATPPLQRGDTHCWLVCLPFKRPCETSDRALSSRQDILSMADLTAQATDLAHAQQPLRRIHLSSIRFAHNQPVTTAKGTEQSVGFAICRQLD